MPNMLVALSLLGVAAAAPMPQAAGGLNLGSLLGSLGGAGGSAGGAPNLGALAGLLGGGAPGGAGGLDIGALISGISGPGGVDSTVITKGYASVAEKLTAFDRAVAALGANSTAGDVTGLAGKLAPVKQALADATKSIKAQTGNVDLISSAGLAGPGEEVTVTLERAADDIIAKKDLITKFNAKAALVKELTDLKTLTTDFVASIESKLPDISKAVASGSSGRPIAALDKALNALK